MLILNSCDGFEGELHDGAADGVVLVVDAVDGGVGVAAAGAVDGVDGVTILGGIVAVDHLDAGREDGEVGDVAAVEGKVDDLARSDGGGAVGFLGVDELVGGGDFNGGADGSGLEGEICRERGADEQLDVFDLGGAEAGGLSFDVVGAAGEEIETKLSVTAGGGGAEGSGAGVGGGDGCVGQRGASGIGDDADDVAGGGGLCQEEVGGDEKDGEKKNVSEICAHVPSEKKQDFATWSFV